MAAYLPRAADASLDELLRTFAAVMLVGPRAVGKTTMAKRRAQSIVRLDVRDDRAPFVADPDAALRGLDEPILLDEWQEAPEVLGAVKRAVDDDARPGRYLLTGSVRAHLDTDVWPGTGRVLLHPVWPMTVAEQLGTNSPPIWERLSVDRLQPSRDSYDVRSYVALALRGGLPEACLAETDMAAARYLASYVEHVATKDLAEGERVDRARIARFLAAYAAGTSGVFADRALWESAGIDRRTGTAYERLLEDLRLVQRIPAWSSNRLKRLVRTPKRVVTDSGVAMALLGIAEPASLLADGPMLGRILETFVCAQLRACADATFPAPRLFHLRQQDGRHEVDIVVEVPGGGILGIEVKATSAPTSSDAAHLVWLREQLGDSCIGGVLLHTGPRTFAWPTGIIAAPISALWT